jgi:hypothetical protein
MVLNIITRLLFLGLVAAAISIDSFVFEPIWLIPPAVAWLLNIRIAMSIRDRSWRDIGYAVSFFMPEMFMWARMGHFVRAWARFFRNQQVDSWAEQAKAEGGSGNAFLSPLLVTLLLFTALGFTWLQLSLPTQRVILDIGWPILGATAVAQTLFMTLKLLRPQKGFRV